MESVQQADVRVQPGRKRQGRVPGGVTGRVLRPAGGEEIQQQTVEGAVDGVEPGGCGIFHGEGGTIPAETGKAFRFQQEPAGRKCRGRSVQIPGQRASKDRPLHASGHGEPVEGLLDPAEVDEGEVQPSPGDRPGPGSLRPQQALQPPQMGQSGVVRKELGVDTRPGRNTGKQWLAEVRIRIGQRGGHQRSLCCRGCLPARYLGKMVLEIPRLQDEELLLRPHTETDADAVLRRSTDPLTVEWTTVPLDYSRETALNYIAAVGVPQPDRVAWALDLDGRYAGSIDLRWQGAGTGGLGFVTAPEFRGRGLMSRAVRLVTAYAFDVLGWDKVNWTANVGNIGSYKPVWRNGFPLPVTVPRLLAHRGAMVDGWFSELEASAPRIPRILWTDCLRLLPEVPQRTPPQP